MLLLLACSLTLLPACTARCGDVSARATTAINRGDFQRAERLLRRHVGAEGECANECRWLLEQMRRIRLDHPLDADQMLTRLRKSIPDVTEADIRRWTKTGTLQHRVIDGEVRYFGRAAGNLIRFCDEARRRRVTSPQRAGWEFDLPAHLMTLVSEAQARDEALVRPVRQRVRYELAVNPDHPLVCPGAVVRCWLPFPQEYRQQQHVRLISSSPVGAEIAPTSAPQRTIFFEHTIDDSAESPCFTAEFEFVTSAFVPDLEADRVQPYDADSTLYRTFTAERPPHIVFTPEVQRIVQEVVGDEPNPLLRARRIFRWVSENIPWCAEMEYSTIPNLSAKGLAADRGDCGVQGMVFITLCRTAGVPARWQSGWQTKPNDWNMHDWSEFYVEPWGWLPADASYGLQMHADQRVREFYCGHLDPYRLIVNLDYGRTLHPPKSDFRSEPADFQRGEIEIDGQNLYYDEWDWDLTLRTLPPADGLPVLEEALDAIIPDLLVADDVPGAVVLVGRKSGHEYEVWQKAYGFAQTDPQRLPMPADAMFDLASLTKPIATGTSLMLLVERGDVQLDDRVCEYLPEFCNGAKRDITIRHLMMHTSGLPPYIGRANRERIIAQAGFPCPDETRAAVRSLDLRHSPGERVTYSCLNAIACAEIVEAVSGRTLGEFAHEHIFEPLGMTDTMFLPPPERQARCIPTTRAARGGSPEHLLRGEVHDPLAAMQGGVSGNAGLFSTAGDLSRFAQMLLNGGELHEAHILQPDTVAAMLRPDDENAERALLWDLYVEDDPQAPFSIGHTGYTGTALRLYPDQGAYAILLTNRVHPDDDGRVKHLRAQTWRTVEHVLDMRPLTNLTLLRP